MREADGVAGEVDQHLPQQRAVGFDRQHVVRKFGPQFHPVGARLTLQLRHHVAQDLVHVHETLAHCHAARFDLGDVQHVVHQRQQVLAVLCDSLQVLQFVRSELAGAVLAHDVGEANYGVKRRAKLMAHAGQEVALGAVGGFCPLARGIQFRFVLLLLPTAVDQCAHLIRDDAHHLRLPPVGGGRLGHEEGEHRHDPVVRRQCHRHRRLESTLHGDVNARRGLLRHGRQALKPFDGLCLPCQSGQSLAGGESPCGASRCERPGIHARRRKRRVQLEAWGLTCGQPRFAIAPSRGTAQRLQRLCQRAVQVRGRADGLRDRLQQPHRGFVVAALGDIRAQARQSLHLPRR